MGLKCKILRNTNNEIELVEAPNGSPSTLYKEALRHTNDPETSLILWSTAYTDSFKDVNGDWESNKGVDYLDKNGEPQLASVLTFLDKNSSSYTSLSNKDLSELSNNLLGLEVNSLGELYQELRKTFYKKGYFDVNYSNLRNSKLYNDVEASKIVNDSELQQGIKDLITKIDYTLQTEDLSTIDQNIATAYTERLHLLTNAESLVGIGKFNIINPLEIDNKLKEHLAGIQDREEFDAKVQDLPYPSLIEKYNENKAFADELFSQYSNLKEIPEYKIEQDGSLSEKKKTESASLLKEVLFLGVGDNSLLDSIVSITRLPEDMWEASTEEIRSLLEVVEDKLVAYNIDAIGLSEAFDEKSQSEMVSFLLTTGKFISGIDNHIIEESDIDVYAEVIDQFFGRDRSQSNRYENVSQHHKNHTLFHIETNKSDITMFKDHNLIRVGENLYHKVAVIKDFTSLYNMATTMVNYNPNIFPKEVYYPYAITNGNVDVNKLKDPINANKLRDSIMKYVLNEVYKSEEVVTSENIADFERLFLYKRLFGHPEVESNQESIDKAFEDFINFEGDFEYLTDSFISDFYSEILKEKQKDSPLYKDILSHFSIDRNGIHLETSDNYTKKNIELLLPNNKLFNNLKQYSLISRDSNLKSLFTFENKTEDLIPSKDFQRAFHIANPKTVSKFRGDYHLVDDLLITENEYSDFIRVSEGIYEKIQEVGNNSFFRFLALPNTQADTYINYKTDIEIDPIIELEKYRSYLGTSKQDSYLEIDNFYSKSEGNNIKDDIDGCK